MKNKSENYPTLIIDKSKPDSFPYDYVVCLDKKIKFVAKYIHYNSELSFNNFISEMENATGSVFLFKKSHKGALVISVIEFLNNEDSMLFTDSENKHLHRLLKFALKKYIFAEVSRTPQGDLGIDNQIK